MKRINQLLFSPVHASTLSLFRIVFGLAMVFQMLYYFRINYTYQFMAGPEILFSYPYLEFLQPLSLDILNVIQAVLLIAALLIAVGLFTSYASLCFFLGFSYFSLIDKTLFNNHLYLFMLFAFLLVFVNSERCYSIRNIIWKRTEKPYIEQWQILLFRFMIFIVYFYGGIVKINADWLSGGVVQSALAAKGLGEDSFLESFIAYGGLAYDLLVGFLLLYKPTRWAGVILVLIFNLTNHFYLFDDIGIFPFVMIFSTIVFFDEARVGKIINDVLGKSETKGKKKKKRKQTPVETFAGALNSKQKRIRALVFAFVIFQLLFPFRYLLFTSNPEWTGIASRFAWRMKMQTRKITQFDMTVQDIPNGTPQEVDYTAFLSRNQELHLVDDPYNVVQLGHYLAAEAKRRGMQNPTVRAEIRVEFNNRPAQLMLVPEQPIEQISLSPFDPQPWLMPLKKLD